MTDDRLAEGQNTATHDVCSQGMNVLPAPGTTSGECICGKEETVGTHRTDPLA